MSRDLTTVSLEDLCAERDAGIAQIRAIRARLAPLDAEITKRSNGRTFILNQVIEGRHAVLLAAGVPQAAIDEAHEKVVRMRAEKHARRGKAVSP